MPTVGGARCDDGQALDLAYAVPLPSTHGVSGNFYSPGMFDQYSDALLDRGCAVWRVNNRGHDPISRAAAGEGAKRLGAAYEDMDDCRYDWEPWVDFA